MKKIVFVFLLIISFAFSCFSQVRIEMIKKAGGTFEVPCVMNGLNLKFIFDTGASYVSLSSSTAEFMLENGYLSKDDFSDFKKVKQADGSTYKAYTINIRRIEIGGLVMTNVQGLVTPTQNAPLLLGMSAIQKLGKVSILDNYLIIDNSNNLTASEKNISIFGLKKGMTYEQCEEVLIDKYGEDEIFYTLINDVVNAIEVYDLYIEDFYFNKLELIFDENDCLAGVQLSTNYAINQRVKMMKAFNDIYIFFSKKYSASKYRGDNKNWGYYFLAYEDKDDYDSYPIKICFTKISKQTTNNKGRIIEKKDYYEIRVTYWEFDELLDRFPVEEEY